MESGRRYQLAQLSGESPFMSLASMMAPASSRSWILSALPNAAARCSGVSALVLQSRINAPVSADGLVTQFGSARFDTRTFTTTSCAALLGLHKAACRGV